MPAGSSNESPSPAINPPSEVSHDAGPGRYYIDPDHRFILFQDEAGDWQIEPNPDTDHPRPSPPDP